MNIFLSVYIKKRRRSGATLRIFDVCNQEKIQVVWYSYLRNDALVHHFLNKYVNANLKTVALLYKYKRFKLQVELIKYIAITYIITYIFILNHRFLILYFK